MKTPLRIAVLKDRYPTKFNVPRASRHALVWKRFLPTNRISPRIEGVTLIPPGGFDVGHFVNRIPVNIGRPYLMSFESHLPRYFGGEGTALFAFMRRRLAQRNCVRIIAMSQFARRMFEKQHAAAPERDALLAKLEVVYPNIVLPPPPSAAKPAGNPLRLTFVGAHFGRKGGAIMARAAELAREKRLPLHFEIISSLVVDSWVDPGLPGFYEPYFRLLGAENVTLSRGLPNAAVMERLRDSDFAVLPTFSDTFGYTAIEAMAAGTPVIATSQGALPEFVLPGRNGILLELPLDAMGEWIHNSRSDKHTAAYADTYREEIERLAVALIDSVLPFLDTPEALVPLRLNARTTAEAMFDSEKTGARLDALYERCLAEWST